MEFTTPLDDLPHPCPGLRLDFVVCGSCKHGPAGTAMTVLEVEVGKKAFARAF